MGELRRSNQERFAYNGTTCVEALDEINARFREHGVGYQYENGKIIRMDSELTHQEVVRPALSLLRHPVFKGANDEFMSAHAHFRRREYRDCLVDCGSAFESTMKIICKKRGWGSVENADAKTLIKTCLDHALVPGFLESHLMGLRSALESGLPTIRNKMGPHGKGDSVAEVSAELASYALHLTAANILLLVKSDEELK